MDRRDAYFKQLVSEGDIDEMFDLVEAADRNYVIDGGLVGVYTGLAVAEAGVPNLTVQVSGGAAYDQTGQRTAIVGAQIVPVAVDKDNVTTEVAGVGNSKTISVFIKFKRTLSNPKNDGNNVVVQYNRNESFEFIVEQSDEGLSPTAPSLKADALLLADIERAFGQTVIEDANISFARRQWAIRVEAGDFSIGAGRVEEAFQAVVTQLDVLKDDLEANGGAALIGYNGGPAWFDGTTNPAATTEAQLDKIVTDLGGAGGAAKVGYAGGTTWANGNTNPATSVELQLDKVVADLASTSQGTARVGGAQISGASSNITAGTLFTQLTALKNASNLDLDTRTTWLGGRTNAATTLFAGIDKIITDLAATSLNDDGMERIGGQSVAGSPRSLSAGSARSQADALLALVNSLESRCPAVWGRFATNGGGAVSIVSNSGISSATCNATRVLVTFSSAFANSNYVAFVTSLDGLGHTLPKVNASSQTTTTCEVYFEDVKLNVDVDPSSFPCRFALQIIPA